MMRVFLHIGSHKTGTTAIQEFASENTDWLQANGVLYPSFDLIGGTRERSHLGMVNRISRSDSLPLTESPALLLSKACMIAQTEGLDLLISAESLFRLDLATAQKVVQTLRTALGSAHFVVLCALRARAEFAESLYRNHFRAYSKVPEAFHEWLERSRGNFEYESIVKRYSGPLQAEVILMPYSKATRDDFVANFFKVVGIDIKESDQPPREKNPSLDVVDCLAKKRVMNDTCDAQLSKAFNNFALKDRLSSDYGFMDRDQEAAFTQSYADENQRLIALTPALETVLGMEVAPMSLSPIDETCLKMVDARIETFQAIVDARARKKRKALAKNQ